MLTIHEIKKKKKEKDFPYYTIIITEEVCENIKRNCINSVRKKLEHYKLMTGEEHPDKNKMLKKCEQVYQSCKRKIGKKGFVNFKNKN